MKKYMLAIPVIAVLAVAGIVAAHPWADPAALTQEQKDFQVQMLSIKQQMTGDQIAYIQGLETAEQFQEKMQGYREQMQQLAEQNAGLFPDAGMGRGHMRGGFGMGAEMGAAGCPMHGGF